MELPALLPDDLQHFSEADEDLKLLQELRENPVELVHFFGYACDDETWSEEHPGFMRAAIEWLTERFFADKLLMAMAEQVATSIREHSHVLHPFVPGNLTFVVEGSNVRGNSLLWGASSEFLREMIRRECRDNNTETLLMPDVSIARFSDAEEFVNTGTVKELWRKEQHEVLAVLRLAAEWELRGLMSLCEDILARYLTEANAVDTLLMSHEEGWQNLKVSCMEFINKLAVGIHLESTTPEYLSLEFIDFREDALEVFEALRFHLTHLAFTKKLPEESAFSEVINRCPNLRCLDISYSDAFSSRLLDIPDTLEELNVSKCAWLTDKNLRQFVDICPNLKKISLGHNAQLTYVGWGVLREWRALQRLDISNSFRLEDDGFNVILQACRHVTHLGLAGCTALSDRAFYELAKMVPRLTDLDLSRCNISDGTLIDLSVHCQRLISLNLTRCPSLTEKGIVEAVRNAPNLRRLNITKCRVPPLMQKEISVLRTFLELTV